jgi:hypothetical protein
MSQRDAGDDDVSSSSKVNRIGMKSLEQDTPIGLKIGEGGVKDDSAKSAESRKEGMSIGSIDMRRGGRLELKPET